MKKAGIRVPGIGHRIKSKDNVDQRVVLLIEYAKTYFPSTRHVDYAKRVEAYTLQKAANLVGDCRRGALFHCCQTGTRRPILACQTGTRRPILAAK
jgi:hypothetical protein